MKKEFKAMNVCVISASMRGGSQSRRISDYLVRRLQALGQNGWLLDLYILKLTPYDDSDAEIENKTEVLRQLANADAYIFVSPEWDGMMSYGLISLLLHVEHEMAHKPVMLVGVSSGRGGAYPIAQMRQMGPKNKHYIISPENLRITNVKEIFTDDEFNPEAADYSVKLRADYCLKILGEYAKALKPIRQNDLIDFDQFGSGV